jgi:hypothetical protein
MIHPHTELQFINAQIGYGVFATHLIPRGTIVWVGDDLDQTFSAAQVEKMATVYRDLLIKYGYINGNGNTVLCWDFARYINHSCDPSCLSPGYNFEIAARDLHPGEELTDDYGSLNLEEDFFCLCGSPRCRRQIRPDDYVTYADIWDRIVAASFQLIPTVPQPLWSLVKEKEEVGVALAGKIPIASCKKDYYPLPTSEKPHAVYSPYSKLTRSVQGDGRTAFQISTPMLHKPLE